MTASSIRKTETIRERITIRHFKLILVSEKLNGRYLNISAWKSIPKKVTSQRSFSYSWERGRGRENRGTMKRYSHYQEILEACATMLVQKLIEPLHIGYVEGVSFVTRLTYAHQKWIVIHWSVKTEAD